MAKREHKEWPEKTCAAVDCDAPVYGGSNAAKFCLKHGTPTERKRQNLLLMPVFDPDKHARLSAFDAGTHVPYGCGVDVFSVRVGADSTESVRVVNRADVPRLQAAIAEKNANEERWQARQAQHRKACQERMAENDRIAAERKEKARLAREKRDALPRVTTTRLAIWNDGAEDMPDVGHDYDPCVAPVLATIDGEPWLVQSWRLRHAPSRREAKASMETPNLSR